MTFRYTTQKAGRPQTKVKARNSPMSRPSRFKVIPVAVSTSILNLSSFENLADSMSALVEFQK